MTLTALDARTALVVIDLQKGIASLPAVHPVAGVVERVNMLAGAFRRYGLLVVLVTVGGPPSGRVERASNVAQLPDGWADLIPELDVQSDDHRVVKHTWGAFTNTGLEAHLKATGVTQVVVVGVATSIGVESTARHARELGFNVTLAIDAMTDLSLEAHDNSVLRIFPRLGETGTTREVVALLDQRGA